MRVTATFDADGLALFLWADTDAEQRMIGALLDQPQSDEGSGYLAKDLVSASLAYEGHWTNKRITRVKLSVYRPNKESA